jgi:hypothetical protein
MTQDEYDDKVFTIENAYDLNDEEKAQKLERVKKEFEASPPPEPAPKTSFLQDVALGGLDLLSSVPVIGSLVQEDPLTRLERLAGTERGGEESYAQFINRSAESEAIAQEQQRRSLAGVPTEAEQGFGGKLTRSLVDPTIVVGPGKFGTGAKAIGSVLGFNVVPNTGINAAVIGSSGIVDRTFPEMSFLGKELATMIAGTSVGVGTGSIMAGFEGARSINPLEALSSADIRTKVAGIKAAEGSPESLAAKLQYIEDLGRIAGIDFTKGFASFIDNPHVKSLIQSYSQTDPEFNVAFMGRLDDMYSKLSKASDEIIGSMDEQDLNAIRKSVQESGYLEEQQALKNRDDAISQVDQETLNLSEQIYKDRDVTTADIGKEAYTVLEDRLNSIKQNVTNPAFDKVRKGAQDRNTELTSAEVGNIWGVAKNQDNSLAFVQESPIASSILRKWEPEEKAPKAPSKILYTKTKEELEAEALRQSSIETYFKPVPVEQIISLDQEVSKLLRAEYKKANPDGQKISRLKQLKTSVEKTINESVVQRDPEFTADYNEAKGLYKTLIAGPIRDTSLRSLNSRTLSTEVFNNFSNVQKVRDYLDFTGEAGADVVRRAYRFHLLGMRDPGTGFIPQTKLNAFLQDPNTAATLRQLGMYDELKGANAKLVEYEAQRQQHNETYNNFVTENARGFFNAIANKELDGVVTDMLNNPAKRENYVSAISRLPNTQQEQIRQALRREFKTKAEKSSQSLSEFVLDETNAPAAKAIFGEEHYGNLVKLARVEDQINQMANTLSVATLRTGATDAFQEATGVSLASTLGTLRNQILSGPRKALNITSQMLTSKGKDLAAKKYENLLLDADVAKELANSMGLWSRLRGATKDKAKVAGTAFVKAFFGGTQFTTPPLYSRPMTVQQGMTVPEIGPQVPFAPFAQGALAAKPVYAMERASRVNEAEQAERLMQQQRQQGMLTGGMQ